MFLCKVLPQAWILQNSSLDEFNSVLHDDWLDIPCTCLSFIWSSCSNPRKVSDKNTRRNIFTIIIICSIHQVMLQIIKSSCYDLLVDIWERNKELIRKRTDIGEHFTREVILSIVFIFLPLGERVHLTNRSITTNPLGNKECLSMWVVNREDCNRSLPLTLVRMIYCSIGEANGI